MFTIDGVGEVPEGARGAYVAVGNFDGVHLGHSHLIARLRANADAAGVPALALSFEPHPVVLLRPAEAPVPLVWAERKVALLHQAGASLVGLFATGQWLLGLTAREFFDWVLVGQFQARGMVEGPNFAFGRDRGGDAALLAKWCSAAGLSFEQVEPTTIDGEFVSSSRIRRCLAAGQMAVACRLLGRPHRLRSVVAHGAGRGAGLGFPTANLEAIDTLIPGDGVYAARAFLEGSAAAYPAACHIGPNATFGEQVRKVEAHLLDFDGTLSLYGRRLELELLEQLRPTRAFAGRDDLLAQVRHDVERTRLVCGCAGGF